jgi:hypothetical protein
MMTMMMIIIIMMIMMIIMHHHDHDHHDCDGRLLSATSPRDARHPKDRGTQIEASSKARSSCFRTVTVISTPVGLAICDYPETESIHSYLWRF